MNRTISYHSAISRRTLVLFVVAALTGCTQNDLLLRPDQPIEIKLKSSVLPAAGVTRAPFEGQVLRSNALKARVAATRTSGAYSGSMYVYGTMTFSGVHTETPFEDGFSGNKYYPADGSDLCLFGLYPVTGWTLTSGGEFEFTGKEDVMVAKELRWSKTEAQVAPDNFPKLEFRHLLTKLNIRLQAEDDDAVAAWGNISKIELVSVKNTLPCSKVGVDIVTGTAAVDAFSAGQTPFKCFGLTETEQNGVKVKTYTDNEYAHRAYSLTTIPTYQAYSLIAPVDLDSPATAGDLKFKVYAEGAKNGAQEVVVELMNADGTDFTGYTQGMAFDVYLQFKAAAITGIACMTDWSRVENSDIEIQ